jgi:hypothetical protein
MNLVKKLKAAGFVQSGAGFRKGATEVVISDGRMYQKVEDAKSRKGYRLELFELAAAEPPTEPLVTFSEGEE